MTHLPMFGRRVCSFHVLGVAGLVGAIFVACVLTASLGRSLFVTSAMACVGVLCFLVLAFVTKAVRGTESLTYYHHEIVIVAACAAGLAVARQPVLPYLDIAALSLGVFLAFGRAGCFLVGCCHGGPSAWGIRYEADAVATGFPRHLEGVRVLPLQLIESAWVLMTVAVGISIALQQPPGSALAWYTIVYGWGRFLFEFLRGDPGRVYRLGFSEAQWTSLVLMSAVSGLQIAGVVPYRSWHIAATISMAAAMVAIRSVSDPSRWITHPRHVEQLASLLNANQSIPVVGATFLGIRVSASHVDDAEGRKELFAFSGVPDSSVPQLVKLAARLKRTQAATASFPGKNGVYHLMFSGERRQHAI